MSQAVSFVSIVREMCSDSLTEQSRGFLSLAASRKMFLHFLEASGFSFFFFFFFWYSDYLWFIPSKHAFPLKG